MLKKRGILINSKKDLQIFLDLRIYWSNRKASNTRHPDAAHREELRQSAIQKALAKIHKTSPLFYAQLTQCFTKEQDLTHWKPLNLNRLILDAMHNLIIGHNS